jgi:hypothetical protein
MAQPYPGDPSPLWISLIAAVVESIHGQIVGREHALRDGRNGGAIVGKAAEGATVGIAGQRRICREIVYMIRGRAIGMRLQVVHGRSVRMGVLRGTETEKGEQ